MNEFDIYHSLYLFGISSKSKLPFSMRDYSWIKAIKPNGKRLTMQLNDDGVSQDYVASRLWLGE